MLHYSFEFFHGGQSTKIQVVFIRDLNREEVRREGTPATVVVEHLSVSMNENLGNALLIT